MKTPPRNTNIIKLPVVSRSGRAIKPSQKIIDAYGRSTDRYRINRQSPVKQKLSPVIQATTVSSLAVCKQPAMQKSAGTSESNAHSLQEHMTAFQQPEAAKVSTGATYAQLERTMIFTDNEDKNQYFCPKCNIGFKTCKLLVEHKRAQKRLLSFDVCQAEFRTTKAVELHYGAHTDERPNHNHQDEKQYICDECGEQFIQLSCLTQHSRVHTGQSPNKCLGGEENARQILGAPLPSTGNVQPVYEAEVAIQKTNIIKCMDASKLDGLIKGLDVQLPCCMLNVKPGVTDTETTAIEDANFKKNIHVPYTVTEKAEQGSPTNSKITVKCGTVCEPTDSESISEGVEDEEVSFASIERRIAAMHADIKLEIVEPTGSEYKGDILQHEDEYHAKSLFQYESPDTLIIISKQKCSGNMENRALKDVADNISQEQAGNNTLIVMGDVSDYIGSDTKSFPIQIDTPELVHAEVAVLPEFITEESKTLFPQTQNLNSESKLEDNGNHDLEDEEYIDELEVKVEMEDEGYGINPQITKENVNIQVKKCDLKDYNTKTKTKPGSKICQFMCSICKAPFTKKGWLNKHMNIHLQECEICKIKFETSAEFTKHRYEIHRNERQEYKCDVCERRFTKKDSLNDHKGIHTGVKPYNCPLCNRAFRLKSSLVRHARVHSGEKPFSCEICGDSFSNKHLMKSHYNSLHTEVKPFNCYVCGMGFGVEVNLKRHIMLHTGERPYICNECGCGFIQHHQLQQHLRKHTGATPYKCPECSSCFKFQSTFNLHLARVHNIVKPRKRPKVSRKRRYYEQTGIVLPDLAVSEVVLLDGGLGDTFLIDGVNETASMILCQVLTNMTSQQQQKEQEIN